MMYRLLRELLFRLDAEAAHDFTISQMMRLQQIPIVLQWIAERCKPPESARKELFGLTFRSPIGIAAGFDKSAAVMPFLAALGFGFLEVGTVTLHPQPGNPKPRLFRYPEQKALVNRLGFNNDGAAAVAERLQSWQRTVPVFVNVGRNKDVLLEDAAENYAACYDMVARHADAVVLNISSPNTPGLRDLQRPDQIERLLTTIPKRGPILIKIAPDLDASQIAEICDVCIRHADGIVCTNTTIDHAWQQGGLSGAPLMRKSTDVLRSVRGLVGANYPLIGVGGVFDREDVKAKMDGGADLVQVYTGFVYEGPSLPSRLVRDES